MRQGTTTLFVALEVATGRVTDAYYERHCHDAIHGHADVEAWHAKRPRGQAHFTRTSGSWLNLVEGFFGIMTRQAIRRFIDGWNGCCHQFLWTEPPDEVLSRARPRQSISDAGQSINWRFEREIGNLLSV